jgi:pimeloyl-ACP methyl ester carboxylesterase
MSEFIEKHYKVNKDLTVFYSDTKLFSNTKSVLVFLHGLGGDLEAFNKFRSVFLKKEYRSISIDFRGHGLSTRANERSQYSFDSLSSDIVNILKKEKIDNYVLIGHCLGGLVAQTVAVRNPKGLKKLVLVNTTPITYPLFKNIGFSKFVKYLAIILEKFLPKNHTKGRRNHKKYINGGDFYIPRIFNDLKHTSVASYGQIISYILNFDLLEEVKKISVPTLVISGGKDKIFPTYWSKKINENIPSSKLKIYDKGDHLFLFSLVDSVVDDIVSFLKS